MLGLTPENRSLVFAEVQKQLYTTYFTGEEIDRALASAVQTFSCFEQRFVPGFCGVEVRCNSVKRLVDFATEVIPALVHAHRFFGDWLPEGLKQKLTNQPQTHDTLFELLCLGVFQPHHDVRYEPTLADGKVPDLMLALLSGQAVYVECKSQSLDSDNQRRFARATGRIHQILDFSRSGFVKMAWAEGLRTEVRLSGTPSVLDLGELERTLGQHVPSEGIAPIAFGRTITLSLVPRDLAFDESLPSPSCVIQVETTPTAIHYRNVHAAVYPWPGLDIIRRRSQRRLLASARRKLRSIPANSYGIICIQTFSSKKFAPDIHGLLPQKEFERVPIVWLNPFDAGQVICRNDALMLRDLIFGDMMMKAIEHDTRQVDRVG